MKTLGNWSLAMLSLVLLASAPTDTAWAQVKVTSAAPAETSQGTVSLDVTIDGSGFDGSAKPKFLVTGTTDSGGITVKNVVVKSSRQLIATIDVAGTAVVNKFDIEVMLDSGRKGKGTTLFAVKAAPQPDPCIGAQSRRFPSLAFTRQATINGVVTWRTILADATGQCEKVVTTYSYNTYSHDVSFRYDAASQTGTVVRGGTGFSQLAATLYVTFDVSGIPTVQIGAYTSILSLADLPIPQELVAAGWVVSSMGDTVESPDGTAILLSSMFDNSSGQHLQVLWTCPFDSAAMTVNRASCHDIHRAAYTDGIAGNWSGRGDSIYVTETAIGGSGTGLYRLRLSDGNFTQIWSRGTFWSAAKATLDSTLRERVAIYEPDMTSLCARVLVIDADSCVGNSCQILNGAGNPARSLTWLPDGRIGGEGQTAPSRKGKCSASGSIVTFDANDTTGSTSTVVTDGSHPDGAGGG